MNQDTDLLDLFIPLIASAIFIIIIFILIKYCSCKCIK
jgi:hypothetical protein